MIALIQRVSSASVTVNQEVVAEIDQGLLTFVGMLAIDQSKDATRLVQRILGYRVFSDQAGKMNLNVVQVSGSILMVPQFTLAADTQKGMRPSFGPALDPELAEPLFDQMVQKLSEVVPVKSGIFGADMAVSLINDGPATFWLET